MTYDDPSMDSCSHVYPHPASYAQYAGYEYSRNPYGYGQNPYDPYRYMEKGSWYVPDVGLDGFGEPYRSYAKRQKRAGADYDVPKRLRPPVVPNGRADEDDEHATASHADDSLDDILFDEDDVTVGEVVAGVAILAVFAVGCVVTAKTGFQAIRHLRGLV